MTQRIPMTQEGYNKIKSELDQLESVEMPKIAEKIGIARSEGDLKENAEYHSQREAQGLLQAKINGLRSKLALATIVDPAKMPRDEVGFGATVHIVDIELSETEIITLVGAGEEDYDSGRYLITSPIGQGLLGKKIGDVAEIAIPKGKIIYKVIDIRYHF